MSDTPPHARSDAFVGASVLHEALVMRREVEIELAEAGEIRSAAVAEATDLLEKARLAAAGVEEQAGAEARAIVEQAREQAVGIVTQARVEAENLLAEAHADAAQYDAWARHEARQRLSGDLAGLSKAIAERRDDLATSIPALEAAITRALVSLDDASWLGVSLVDQFSISDDVSDHDGPRHRPQVSLRAVGDLDDLDDLDDLGGPDGADAADAAGAAGEFEGHLTIARPGHRTASPARPVDPQPAEPPESAEPPEPPEPSEPAETAEQWASVRLVSSSHQSPDADAAAAEAVDDRHRGPRCDDEARPLGWLFRSSPTP